MLFYLCDLWLSGIIDRKNCLISAYFSSLYYVVSELFERMGKGKMIGRKLCHASEWIIIYKPRMVKLTKSIQ